LARWRDEIGAIAQIGEAHELLRKTIQGFAAKAHAGH